MLYTTLLKLAFRRHLGAPPGLASEAEGAGLVVVADGVGGLDLLGTGLTYVVPAAGLPHEVRVSRWGHGRWRWYADLTDTAHLADRAAALAAEVAAFRAGRPGAPVFLVGKSGGSGVVVRALEALPPEAVEAAVLVAPALSPGYDLSGALRAVRRELVVFYSPLDVFILGLGTQLFGTIDRVRGLSAGLVGFRVPAGLGAGGRAEYAKLRQVRWRPAMARTGYLGGHVGPDVPAFLRRYIVPLLTVVARPEPDSGAGSSRGRPAPIT